MKRTFKAIPGKGIVASETSNSLYDRYRKGQVLLSDDDYNYLKSRLDEEVASYLEENDYNWFDSESDTAVIPEVRFKPSKDLMQEAKSKGYKIVKNRSKHVPDYEYYLVPLDFQNILNK